MSRPDLDSLLNFLLPFAQDMLAKHGEFFPFAATMSVGGELAKAASYTGSERPASMEVLEVIEDGLRQSARNSEIRAAAVCVDARVQAPGTTEKTDAIQVKFEHSDGEAIEVFLPYRKGFLRRLKYGELFATQGTRTLFQR
jgi:hypothetical protein